MQRDLAVAVARNELFELHYQPQARMQPRSRRFRSAGALAPIRSAAWSRRPMSSSRLAEDSGLIVSNRRMGSARRPAAKPRRWPSRLDDLGQRLAGAIPQRRSVALVDAALVRPASPRPPRTRNHRSVLLMTTSATLATLRRNCASSACVSPWTISAPAIRRCSYLRSFPFDKIKIDQTFVANLDRNPQSAAIVRAVIGLGRGLHYRSSPRASKRKNNSPSSCGNPATKSRAICSDVRDRSPTMRRSSVGREPTRWPPAACRCALPPCGTRSRSSGSLPAAGSRFAARSIGFSGGRHGGAETLAFASHAGGRKFNFRGVRHSPSTP